MKSSKNLTRTSMLLAAGFILFVLLISNLICQTTSADPGEVLYEQHCQNCHMEDGLGLRNLIPPLAGADYLRDNQQYIPCILKWGHAGAMTVNGRIYDQPMPGVEDLTPGQITNLMNYINNTWGNDYGKVQLKDVEQWLIGCPRKEPVEIFPKVPEPGAEE